MMSCKMQDWCVNAWFDVSGDDDVLARRPSGKLLLRFTAARQQGMVSEQCGSTRVNKACYAADLLYSTDSVHTSAMHVCSVDYLLLT